MQDLTPNMLRRIMSCALIVATTAFPHHAGAYTLVSEKVEINDVTDPSEMKQITDALQGELRRMGSDGRITECRIVLDYTEQGNPDSSYGAVCTLNAGAQRLNLAMCNDWMIGKFSTSINVTNKPDLVRFVAQNCPPGG